MNVSIIIPNFNGRIYLEKCLRSFEIADIFSADNEVIVVDNRSSDDSVSFLRSSFPQVHIVELKKNMGFGKAINIGVEHADGKYIVLLNNDTVVEKGWLPTLVKSAESDHMIGAVCSKTFWGDTSKIQNAGLVLFRQGYGRDRGAVVNTKKKQQDYEEDTAYFSLTKDLLAFSGVSVLIQKQVFQKLGGFDPMFFMYYEDADLSIRMKKAGYRIVYEPASVLRHIHSGSSKENSLFFLQQSEQSRLIYLIKHFSLTTVIHGIVWFHLQMIFAVLHGRFLLALTRLKVLVWLFFHIPNLVISRIKTRMSDMVEFKKFYDEMY